MKKFFGSFFQKRTAFCLALALIAALQALTTPWHGGFWGGDAARHALNGALVHDWIVSRDWRHPVAFATRYYLHYPAITIALYPPLVPAVLALFYAMFGVSQAAALGMIFAFAMLALASTYAIARIALPPQQSLGAVCLMAAMPVFADMSRQVMLEVPSAALALAGAACLLRYFGNARMGEVWAGAALAVAAAYAKQTAGFSLVIWPLLLVWQQRFDAARSRKVWLVAASVAAALVPLAIYTLTIGRWSLGAVVANAATQGGATEFYAGPLFYLASLPSLAGWVTLPLALLCLAIAPFARWTAAQKLLIRWATLWAAVTLIIISLLAHKDPRYAIYSTLPLPLLATLIVDRVCRWLKPGAPLAAACTATLGAGAFAVTLLTQHFFVVGGYEPVGRDIARLARPGEIVMFEGLRVHNFAFALRESDPRAPFGGPIVLRPIKFLVGYTAERALGTTDRHLTSADIAALIDRYAVRLVVLQPGFWADLPSVAAFEAYIRAGRFRLVSRYAVTGDLEANESHWIEIWENQTPSHAPPARIDFDMPLLGGRIDSGAPGP
jgi:4-amino-4-deoxy-L-arabinose transferase-like glycosyltransferase